MKSAKFRFGVVFRIVISLLMTFYLAVHGQDLDFIGRVILQPAFYLSMAASFPVTFAIVYWIHWITLVLDEKYDWRLHVIRRGFIQSLLGVLVPVGFDLLFVTAYALFDPAHFNRKEFFTVDLPMVVILIVALNLIYALRSLMREPMGSAEQEPTDLDESPTILVRYGKVSKKLDVKQDILYFYLSKPNVMVVTSEREYSLGKGTINKMEELYFALGFCRISSRTLVNMSIVKDLSPATARYNFKLGFFDPSAIPNPDSDDLLVKGEYREMVIALLDKA
jgi:hypothetical protein